jgi:hypothetical protein
MDWREQLTDLVRRRRRALVAAGWAIGVIGYLAFAGDLWSAVERDGGTAYDARAYWLAGRHVLSGDPLYGEVGIGDPGAYRYLPTFAYLMVPFAPLPELAFAWLYRIVALLCLRYLVGSWMWVGWALLLPPVSIELLALNVTLPIAAAQRWALRGGPAGAALLPFAAVLKYGSALLLPYLWLRRPGSRRALAWGVAGLAAAIAIHVAVEPAAWRAFVSSLVQQSTSINQAPFVGEQLVVLVPTTLGDFLLRLGIAAVLTLIAWRKGWDWLAFSAATIAVPTLWVARLAPLVAVPRLWWEERAERARADDLR